MKTKTTTFLDVTEQPIMVSENVEKLILKFKKINENLNEHPDLDSMFKKIRDVEREEEVAIISKGSKGSKESGQHVIVNIQNQIFFIIAHTYSLAQGVRLQDKRLKYVFCLGIQNLED